MIASLLAAPEEASELEDALEEHLRTWLEGVLSGSEADLWDAVGDDLSLRVEEDGLFAEMDGADPFLAGLAAHWMRVWLGEPEVSELVAEHDGELDDDLPEDPDPLLLFEVAGRWMGASTEHGYVATEDGPVREGELDPSEREAWQSVVEARICRCSACAVARRRADR
ncbi:MAG: hypothetical protein H6736_15720 [Alphaproteobacteria bacterium]|nr:hypothetical protein [Alphaproteobacteria bacterium]MCB9693259.1 hypothetical protein [Alphaproteobacteria bacterium]